MNATRRIAFVLAALCSVALLPNRSTAQSQWPNLDVLSPFHGEHTNSCSLEGAAAGHPGEKANSNRLKNRYHLPDKPFEEITFDDLIRLNQGRVSSQHTVVGFPKSDDPNDQRGVKFTGYVVSATPSGCAKRQNSQGESCNCNTIDKTLCDAHVEVVSDPDADHGGGHGVVVVEVTERSRRLASMGLLDAHNSIGHDWSSSFLHDNIVNHWVTFYGWLFYDADHFDQAWIIDPDDSIGKSNFRETAWEVHPVMGIEVLPGRPAGFQPLSVNSMTQPNAATSRALRRTTHPRRITRRSTHRRRRSGAR